MTENQTLHFKGLFIWSLCALFFTYEFMLRTLLGTFEHPLLNDLNLSLISFSILSSSAYQSIYGLMQLPVGVIFDKLGLKKVLTLAILVCAISVIGFSMTHQFKSAFIFRLCMGFGSSFGFIALLVVVYDWLPANKTGLFIGLSQFIGTLGPMLAAGPVNALAESGGIPWRSVFMFLGIIGLCLAFFVFCFVENNRNNQGSWKILKINVPIKNMLLNIIQQKQMWYIGIYSASIYFSIEYLSENSGKAYLMLHGYSSQNASNLITLSWLGYAIGCPALGFLSDYFCRRKALLVFASIILLLSGGIILFFAHHPLLLVVGFLLLGIGASGQSVAFATIAEQCQPSYLAAGLGFNNACIILFASVLAPIIGWLLNHLSTLHLLEIKDYQTALSLLLMVMFLSFIKATFFIKETYCKSTTSATKLGRIGG